MRTNLNRCVVVIMPLILQFITEVTYLTPLGDFHGMFGQIQFFVVFVSLIQNSTINYETHVNFSEAFDGFADDPGLSLTTITVTGTRAFCVGNDLKLRHERGNDVMPESEFGDLPGVLTSTNL